MFNFTGHRWNTTYVAVQYLINKDQSAECQDIARMATHQNLPTA